MQPLLAAAEGATGLAHAAVAEGAPALTLAWLIPVVPAVSAGVLLLFGRRLRAAAAGVAIAAVTVSAVLSTLVFVTLLGQPPEERTFLVPVARWIAVGDLQVAWELLIDPLASVMLLLVTWVGLLIHIYSVGYMHGDELYPRFFAFLNLFTASMLVLVTGSSLLTTFVGWELVGLSSYLLIGFWFAKRAYAGAATKAFVVNRIGDVGFLIAMFVVFAAFGTLDYAAVLPEAGAVLTTGAAVAVTLLLFAAATGKSAQIPLFVWLPDAMAGPTPVSALIHAATMVTAGVYLIARTSPLYALVPDVGLFVAWIGVLTALLAALIACAQDDLKRILAYSTVSQLGFMVVGVGLGDQVSGIFHLLTHGFFKALLFLAAGSVMHALADRTDIWGMGGLRKVMPVTFATSAVGWLAIAGVPPLAGFWSKEEILAAAADTPGGELIWMIGALTAGLTAFYMSRWFFLIFLGKPRYGSSLHPHESPASMTLPLVVLAVGSALGGLLNAGTGFLHGWLEPSVTAYAGHEPFLPEAAAMGAVLVLSLAGIGLAVMRYLGAAPGVHARASGGPAAAGQAGPSGVVVAAGRGFYIDQAYDRVLARPGRWFAELLWGVDRRVIDGAVNGAGWLTERSAQLGRRAQTGYVRSYALATLLGAVLVTALLLGGAALGQGS